MLQIFLYILIPTLLLSDSGDSHFYSVFGHAALRMQSPETGDDYTFTYVGEKLNDKAFARYLSGNLKMGLEVMPTELYLQRSDRTIREYPLQMPESMAVALLAVCDRELKRGYNRQYNPITGSCSHMLALYLNEAAGLEGIKIVYADDDDPDYSRSVRELCEHYTAPYPWVQWIYTSLPGSAVDSREIDHYAHLMFPAQLRRHWNNATIGGQHLLGEEGMVLVEGNPLHPPFPVTPLAVAIALLMLTVLSLGSGLGYRPMGWLSLPLEVVVAVFGTILMYIWLFTSLPYTEWNWLLLPLNPLLVALRRWRRWWGIPYAVVLVGLLAYTYLAPYSVMIPAMQVLTITVAVWSAAPGLWELCHRHSIDISNQSTI